MAKRYSPEVRAACRRTYAQGGHNLKHIATLHSVPYDTLRVWKRKAAGTAADWDRARRAERISEGGMDYVTRMVRDEFAPLLDSTIKHLRKHQDISPMEKVKMCTSLADCLHKTIASITKANPELQKLAFAMDLLRAQIKWAREHKPHLVDGLIEMLEPFGEHVSHLHG